MNPPAETGNRLVQRFLPTLEICFAICCWGSAYIAARYLLHPMTAGIVVLSPISLATLRFSIASLFFLLPLVHAIVHRRVSGRDVLMMALLGQLTFSLYYWLQYRGIQETNAGVSAILGVGLIPLFTTLLAHPFRKERLHVPLLIALSSGLLGVVLLVLQQPLTLTLRSGFLLGAGCLVSNTFFFALYTHLSKRWMEHISPLVMTSGTMVSGTLVLILLSFLDPSHATWQKVFLLSGVQWGALLFLSLACSVLAYFVYNRAVQKMDVSRVAIYFYVEPAIPLVLGALLLGEQLSWHVLVGAVLITISVFIVNLRKTKSS